MVEEEESKIEKVNKSDRCNGYPQQKMFSTLRLSVNDGGAETERGLNWWDGWRVRRLTMRQWLKSPPRA